MKTNYEVAVEYRKWAKDELEQIARGIRLQVYNMARVSPGAPSGSISVDINNTSPDGYIRRLSHETWKLITEILSSPEVGGLLVNRLREKIYAKAKLLGDAARSEAEKVLMEGGLE